MPYPAFLEKLVEGVMNFILRSQETSGELEMF